MLLFKCKTSQTKSSLLLAEIIWIFANATKQKQQQKKPQSRYFRVIFIKKKKNICGGLALADSQNPTQLLSYLTQWNEGKKEKEQE